MKKLVLMAVAIVAVSFASCGNKAADAAKATQDSIRIADSLAAVEAAIHIVTMTVGGMESKVTDNKVVILTAAAPANKSKSTLLTR